MSRLKEEDLAESIDRLVSDAIWDWTNYYNYAKYRLDPKDLRKPTPTQRKQAFHFGLMLCRGTVQTMAMDSKPDINHYNYHFMLGTRLLRVGARDSYFDTIKNLYYELKPGLTESQIYNLLHLFVACIFESKGTVRQNSLELFIAESQSFAFQDQVVEYSFYSLWRGLLEDKSSPKLSRSQRAQLQSLVNGLQGSKTQRTYDRNKSRASHHVEQA